MRDFFSISSTTSPKPKIIKSEESPDEIKEKWKQQLEARRELNKYKEKQLKKLLEGAGGIRKKKSHKKKQSITKTKTYSPLKILGIKLAKNDLKGYSSKLSKQQRIKALKKLINSLKRQGFDTRTSINKLIKRLNLIAIYNKNKNPLVSSIYRLDIMFLQKLRSQKTKK